MKKALKLRKAYYQHIEVYQYFYGNSYWRFREWLLESTIAKDILNS